MLAVPGYAPVLPHDTPLPEGTYYFDMHPSQYLDLMCELHGGYPQALARWERRITRERAIPKPRLP